MKLANRFHGPPILSIHCQVESKTIYELVSDELEGELSDETRNALGDHLLRCRACVEVYSRLKNIIRVSRAYAGDFASAASAQSLLKRPKNRRAILL